MSDNQIKVTARFHDLAQNELIIDQQTAFFKLLSLKYEIKQEAVMTYDTELQVYTHIFTVKEEGFYIVEVRGRYGNTQVICREKINIVFS